MLSTFRRLATLVALTSVLAGTSALSADDPALDAIDRASRAQAAALDLLQQHHRFEEDLVKREGDRLTIFFSTRQGDGLNPVEMALYIDGKRVATHRYTPDERRGLQGRAVQLVHAGRVEQGVHEIQFMLQLESGVSVPLTPRKFAKGRDDKFIEIQLTGGAARSYAVLEW